MARYNEILVGRFNRHLQKLLGMKGPAVMAQLASDLQPVLPFVHGIENDYLSSWNHFGQHEVVASPGAGLIGAVRLRNPAGSNMIAVIKKVIFFDRLNAVTQDWRISYGHLNTAFAGILADLGAVRTYTSAPGAALDTRSAVNSQMVVTDGNIGAAGIGNSVWAGAGTGASGAMALVEAISKDADQLPLLPNDTLTLWSNFQNQNFSIVFWWKERFLEDSERT